MNVAIKNIIAILTIVCALDLVKKGTAKPSRDAKGSILLVLLTF